uniref:NACHT domain-containing protein n=1 Tax=Amphimedon queenslandica TaxID=400682 RepID=A0A1X7SZR9_AMPQE
MIDVSQWRASIGLWNYCQAASSRPATVHPVAHQPKSDSTKRKKKSSLVLSFMVLLLFISILCSGYLKFEYNPHLKAVVTHCYWSKVHCTNIDSSYLLQSMAPGSDVSSNYDVFYSLVYLIYRLLLSGDVELNPGPITGNPKDILRTHSVKLTDAITTNLYRVTDALYAEGLIPLDTKENIQTVTGISDYRKSSQLVSVIQRELESSLNPEQYLIDICHVLINQQHRTLTDIATSILHQLGQSIPDNVSSHTVLPSPVDDISNTPVTNIRGQSIPDNVTSISLLPDDVQGYADNMRQHYKHQPIVATDWPPRIGKDFFGRLAIIKHNSIYSSIEAETAWYLLREHVDKLLKSSKYNKLSIEDVLQPTDSSLSLRVIIDGPPGIGKTTLCRKLLNMWSNGPLVHQQYDLVLYCPLRNSKIATATTLADLFVHQLKRYKNVPEWFEDRDGEGLLIIFDGWDELSEQLRQSSLAASIICKEKLEQCSVIVTSRSYASSSLLKMGTLSRHVQVIGFSEKEISTVIIRTLQKDTKLAQELIDKKRKDDENDKPFTTTQSSKDSQLAVKLINDLVVRNDVQSLCYVPLVCSMVILVYCKEGGHLPTTLTQLYENFILQTIRRHVKRHDIDPHTLGSLSSLPSQLAKPLQEMCRLAYSNLANTRMTFSSHQLQSLSEAVKEDYLGLMTRFTEYNEEKYQFLHLSIQEFLAAW